jgi:hypothetical protein
MYLKVIVVVGGFTSVAFVSSEMSPILIGKMFSNCISMLGFLLLFMIVSVASEYRPS